MSNHASRLTMCLIECRGLLSECRPPGFATAAAAAVLALSFLKPQFAAAADASPSHLPGSAPLEANPDFSATMVAGIDRFLLRQIAEAKDRREQFWQRDSSSPEAYAKSVEPNRQRLREIIGAGDARLPVTELEFVGGTAAPSLWAENARAAVHRVRWPVLPGVHGEGLLIQPKGRVLARVVYIPDADTSPEEVAGFKNGKLEADLLNAGVQILIPTLISRGSEFSGNPELDLYTNCPHREWIYRQSFILGRHIIGYEVQKILAVVDWFAQQDEKVPVLVAGLGEGGLLALYSGAVDPRIDSVYVWGYFSPREDLWKEPIYRNVNGLLREFGDAEIASLIAPRRLAVQHLGFPKVSGPPEPIKGRRNVAAPGVISTPEIGAVRQEIERAQHLAGAIGKDWIRLFDSDNGALDVIQHLLPLETAAAVLRGWDSHDDSPVNLSEAKADAAARQERQVRELEASAQRRLAVIERERNAAFWKKLPLASVQEFEAHTEAERERFWTEVIGRFPDPDEPMNVKSRLVRETDTVRIYEVTLDVWPDVFAWGWLCLPKNLKADERRPVVVCQHGLEGIPEDTINMDPNLRSWGPYKGFAFRLAEEGFVTFAPHNLYRGKDAFRTLQRKLNPLGKSLYSVINGQHQRILEWLKEQPFTDPQRIAFYGLSYGGKSAMRTPSVLKDYCLSICSGDFNEWVRKCATIDLPMSYVFTHEFEIWEWNLGGTFNYAEMAALIAPRPFMVERGHNDGVGIDEWVNYEFAKVRRLYNKLGIGDRTTIEHFDGPHTIHGVGTFEFLKEKLDWRKP